MNRKFFILLLFFLGFFVHGATLFNGLFWDDDDNIVKNVYIQNFDPGKIFTRNQIEGSLDQTSNQYRPLLLLTYAVEYKLWGLWTPGYHFTNMLLHVVNSILVFLIIKALLTRLVINDLRRNIYDLKSMDKKINHRSSMLDINFLDHGFINLTSFFSSLLFLLHPIQTEAVAYVAGRTDLLATFFMLVGLIIHIIRGSRQKVKKILTLFPTTYYLLTLYILALLSKETAIVFPALLFMTAYFFMDQQSLLRTLLGRLRLWISLAGISLGYILLRLTIFNFQNSLNFYGRDNIYTTNIVYRILTFLNALAVYGQLLLAPIDLHMERTLPITRTLFNLPAMIGFFIVIISLIIVSFGIKRAKQQLINSKSQTSSSPLLPPPATQDRPACQSLALAGRLRALRAGTTYYLLLLSYGLLWFFITILPTSNILVPINSILAEHFLYLPSIGLFFIAGFSVVIFYEYVWNKSAKWNNWRYIIMFPLFLLFTFYSLRSIERSSEWHDPVTFYEQTLRFAPQSGRVRNNLAMSYANLGNQPKAIENYRLAIKTDDRYPQTHYNLANSLSSLGQTEAAIAEYEQAIAMDRYFLPPYPKLITLFQAKKDQTKVDKLLLELQRMGVLRQN